LRLVYQMELTEAMVVRSPGRLIVCLEFKRPDRLVATEKFDKPWYPGEAVGTIALLEKNGVTELTPTLGYESAEAREIVRSTPIEHGLALGYDRLAGLLDLRKRERERGESDKQCGHGSAPPGKASRTQHRCDSSRCRRCHRPNPCHRCWTASCRAVTRLR
jgi:hypothetical protein